MRQEVEDCSSSTVSCKISSMGRRNLTLSFEEHCDDNFSKEIMADGKVGALPKDTKHKSNELMSKKDFSVLQDCAYDLNLGGKLTMSTLLRDFNTHRNFPVSLDTLCTTLEYIQGEIKSGIRNEDFISAKEYRIWKLLFEKNDIVKEMKESFEDFNTSNKTSTTESGSVKLVRARDRPGAFEMAIFRNVRILEGRLASGSINFGEFLKLCDIFRNNYPGMLEFNMMDDQTQVRYILAKLGKKLSDEDDSILG